MKVQARRGIAIGFIAILILVGAMPIFSDNPILTKEEEQVLLLFQNAFRKVADTVQPVVVQIDTINVVKQPSFGQGNQFFEFFFRNQPNSNSQPDMREFRQQGIGSGVIVRKTGDKIYILTNNHVVGNADEINVTMSDGRVFNAELVGKDPRKDLALISFTSKENIPVARIGNSDNAGVGDWVVAVGNPMGFESTVTAGIISAVGRESIPGMGIAQLTDYIQTDAAINQGNSGGALVNIRGEVIGINTWIASQTGGNVGLGFAIPINNATKAIDDFILKGRVDYGWLGVNISDPSFDFMKEMDLENKKGAFVYDVFKKSPADKAGILPGDLITHVNGKALDDSNDLVNIVADLPAGRFSTFTVIRLGQTMTVNVKTAVRDDDAESASAGLWPGFVAVHITDEIRERLDLDKRKGDLVIANVREGSPASTAGLRPGDIIREVNGSKVRNVLDFYEELNDRKVRNLELTIYR
jgi:serine protease Do